MKNRGKVFAFLFIALLLSTFLISVVSAVQTPQEVAKAIYDPIKSMFADWTKGNLSVNVAKYMFLILLSLVLYSILEFVPFLGKGDKNKYIRAPISIIIAFLSTAYLTKSDIYTILASYSSLGFVLSAAIPFIILVFFTIEMRKEGGVGGILISKFIWFAFIIFLIYKLLYGTYGIKQISGWESWGYIIFIGLSILYIWIFEKWLNRYIRSTEADVELAEISNDAIATIEAQIAEREGLEANLPNNSQNQIYRAKTQRLREKVRELKARLDA